MRKLPSHWSEDTVKGFWRCFWYDVFMIVLGALMFIGSVVSVFFVSVDFIPACISIAGSGAFLVIIGAGLLFFLFDF